MRALLSVSDKTNIVEFAKGLTVLGWEIVSTGGTYQLLLEHGILSEKIEDVTGFPEILDGRVKTLHPHVAAGILYRRERPSHIDCMKQYHIKNIDMVVCQLYPFEEGLSKGSSLEQMIEWIDIGGPTMIRSAAKNFRDVIVITDINDYEKILQKLKKESLSLEDRKSLAAKAFQITAHYDALIASYLSQDIPSLDSPFLTLTFGEKKQLRYGENPHQRAFYYQSDAAEVQWKQLHGKELSYNNLKDMDSAFSMIKNFPQNTVIAIKHNHPCGIARGDTLAQAYEKAYRCDRESIFGGIVICNGEVNRETAEKMSQIFLEIVLAPSFQTDALTILQQKKNIRLITYKFSSQQSNLKYIPTMDGMLVQEEDRSLWEQSNLEIYCETSIPQKDWQEIEFAMNCAKCVASNGVVIVRENATVGIGQGQTKRAWAVEEAMARAGNQVENSIFVSDGFFFSDTVELLRNAKLKYVISPGGSIHDQEVIQSSKEHKIPLIFTHQRHFRH